MVYSVSRYWGIGIHYFGRLEATHNLLRYRDKTDGSLQWGQPWRDSAGVGRSYEYRSEILAEVNAWAKRTFARRFGKRYRLEAKHQKRRWFYRESDA